MENRFFNVQRRNNISLSDLNKATPLLPKRLNKKTRRFLKSLGLTVDQLIITGIQLNELERVVCQGNAGKILHWLMTSRTLQKMLLLLALREQDIKPSMIKNDDESQLKPSNECCTCVWPRGEAILLQTPRSLRKTYGITAFVEAIEVSEKIWDGLITSVLINDIILFAQYPTEYSYNILNVLFQYIPSFISKQRGAEDALTAVAREPFIWPLLIGIPVFIGVINAIRESCHVKSAANAKHIQREIKQIFLKHRKNIWNDGIRWLFTLMLPDIVLDLFPQVIRPLPRIKYALETIQHNLGWDGRFTAKQRLKLFTDLRKMTHKSKKFT